MLVILLTSAVFVSSVLVFLVQPLFAKMLLPHAGGAPAVWNACVVFFQVVLLAGYLYAHLSIRWLGVQRRQSLVHLGVLALPLLALPIAVPPDWTISGTDNPVGSVFLLLLTAVGLPFFAVTTTAPMLQRWLASSNHPHAQDPYFLYSASNIGSLVALIAYPALLEPSLRLRQQSTVWMAGYVVLVALIGGCVWAIGKSVPAQQASGLGETVAPDGPSTSARLRWLVLAAVPSSLMLSVTAYLATDIAPVPLLWIVPLAIYLLTFVMAFARRPLVSAGVMAGILPIAMLPAVYSIVTLRVSPVYLFIPLHLFAFFCAAAVCHGELAKSRPSAAHLTEFYVWMSLGGALGGVFNTFVAPLAFPNPLEYPIGLVLACVLRPAPVFGRLIAEARQRGERRRDRRRASREQGHPIAPPSALSSSPAPAAHPLRQWLATDALGDLGMPLVVGAVAWTLSYAAVWAAPDEMNLAESARFALPVLVCLGAWPRPARFALCLAALIGAALFHTDPSERRLTTVRNFFGAVHVDENDLRRELMHGTTNHGWQARDPRAVCEPLTYYQRSGPVGQVFRTLGATPRHVGIVGLGTGSMGGYARPGDAWTFFEINPAVARIAEDPRYFTFLTKCVPQHSIVLGDARLSLASAAAGQYDLLVIDAFASDAIPIHLLTAEALAIYRRTLTDTGLVMFHISNRYLHLEPVLARLAEESGMRGLIQFDADIPPRERRRGRVESTWVVMSQNWKALDALAADARWRKVRVTPAVGLWTDDFSDLWSVFHWQ